MNRIALAVAVLVAFAAPALAADPPSAEDPMAGWVPPKVKNDKQDRQEIRALLQAMEQAGMKGDLDAAAAIIDFPVLMITDDKKGQAMGEPWDREKWLEIMRPMYKPMPGVKVAHKTQVFLLTDSLASVTDEATMTMGKKVIPTRNAVLLVRRDGKWKVKAMAEGGWGDMPMGDAGTAGSAGGTPPAQAPAGQGGGGAPPAQAPAGPGAGGAKP